MHPRLTLRPLAGGIAALALLLAACSGSTASPSASSAAGGAASQPAAASAPAASEPASSDAGGAASFALPSGFNADADLEAQLPSTFCNTPTQKFSLAGNDATVDADFLAVIQKLGKTAADTSVATAATTTGECAGINLIALRVKGVDQGQFEQAFIASQNAKPDKATKTNVGGKDVWTFVDNDETNYIYFKGDTIFGVTAPDQAGAAKGLAVLP
ncbi:MAG: hypothetical protein ACJ77B_00520 [Chloroflexota bacterium]